MNSEYVCNRCNYKSTHMSDLIGHLRRKKTCAKKIASYNYSDDQNLILSLVPYYNNSHEIDMNDIQYLKKSNKMWQNKKVLLNTIEKINKDKCKKCSYCSEEFQLISDLKKHILTTCFYKYINVKEEMNQMNQNNVVSSGIAGNNNSLNIENSHNTNNTNNTTNITNNMSFNVALQQPIPFEDKWDVSKIDEQIKQSLLISNIMYTNLLKEILKNEMNLNIIIDKESNSGMVYKNDIDKYIKMKSIDIVDNTMKKLNQQLLEINKDTEVTKTIFPEIEDFSRKMINKKYIDYTKNNTIKTQVAGIITNILDSKKEDAIKMSTSIDHEKSIVNYENQY